MRRDVMCAVLTLLVACTASGTPTSPSTSGSPGSGLSSAPYPVPRPASCPSDLQARLRRNTARGLGHRIVPGHPTALVLCEPGHRVVVTGRRVRTLSERLNRLKRVPPGVAFACPFDSGPTYGLFFNDPGGGVVLVTVEASGCRFASNGRLSAWTDPRLLMRIRSLFDRP